MKYIKGGDSEPEKNNFHSLDKRNMEIDNALTRNDENDYDVSPRNLMQEEDMISVGNMSP